jgi:hypothetical protein
MSKVGYCAVCQELRTIEPIWSSCRECYQTGRAISKANDISMSRALIRLGDEIRKSIDGEEQPRKVLKKRHSEEEVVNVKNYIDPRTGNKVELPKPVTIAIDEELYRELEYDFIEADFDDTPNFGSVNQQIFTYRQLLDIALLGGDIEWARKLNNKIKQAKGIEK